MENKEAVRYLLQRRVEVHQKDKSGRDACDYAKLSPALQEWPEFRNCPNSGVKKSREEPIFKQTKTISESLEEGKKEERPKAKVAMDNERVKIMDPIIPAKINPLEKLKIPDINSMLEEEESKDKRF